MEKRKTHVATKAKNAKIFLMESEIHKHKQKNFQHLKDTIHYLLRQAYEHNNFYTKFRAMKITMKLANFLVSHLFLLKFSLVFFSLRERKRKGKRRGTIGGYIEDSISIGLTLSSV